MNQPEWNPAWDEMFAKMDQAFASMDEAFKFMPTGTFVQRTVTYTTNSTADPKPKGSYTDGFDDGWNAREVSK